LPIGGAHGSPSAEKRQPLSGPTCPGRKKGLVCFLRFYFVENPAEEDVLGDDVLGILEDNDEEEDPFSRFIQDYYNGKQKVVVF